MGTALIIKGADFSINAVGDIGETGIITGGGLGKPLVDKEFFDRHNAGYAISTPQNDSYANYFCRTQPISVTPGKVLNISIPGFSDFSLRAVVYDASDNNITHSSSGIVIGAAYTIPADAAKIGLNICTDSKGGLTVIPYETAKKITIRLS